MNEFTILRRKLTSEEAVLMQEEVKKTPNITGYTVNEWEELGEVFVAIVNQKLAGVCADKEIGGDWVEIAALLILDEYRGKGIGKTLISQAFEWAEKEKKNIYIVSRNPVVIRIMEERKLFITSNPFILPLVIQWHNIKLLFSFYRAKEFIRKLFVYKIQPPFYFGLKIII